MKTFNLLGAAVIAGLAMGLGYNLYNGSNNPVNAAEHKPLEKLDTLPELTYPDLQGNPRSTSEWQDQVLILNFWATWCPPCRKEIPHFIELQEQHKDNVRFIGIAIDDLEAVQEFANIMGINYPTLLGDMNAIGISKQLGNRFSGLPFTAIFDQNGKLKHHQTGGISKQELEAQISKLL